MALKLHIGIPESCSEGPAATIALPHQTHDDHGDEDEGCLGQDNNECFALKFVMILKKIMITKKKKSATSFTQLKHF